MMQDRAILAMADQCVISRLRDVASNGNLNHDICFSIGGSVIENVKSWPHLPTMLAISWIF